MAKFVLMAFDDDKEADDFVESVQKMQGALIVNTLKEGEEHSYTEPAILGVQAKIRGVYRKPTKFCTCGHSKDDKGFTRGKKYGWWVHATCGMPRQRWAEEDRWDGAVYSSLGRNLLPVTEEAPEWRGDGIRGHVWQPETKQWINVKTGEPYGGRKDS